MSSLAILVPAIHRAPIGAVDADVDGRFVLATDLSGFAAVHDLEDGVVRLAQRVGSGGEPRTYARLDAGATVALVAFTEDEDDPDAVGVWDLRRDRLTTLPDDFAGWIGAIATNDAIDTIALVVHEDEHPDEPQSEPDSGHEPDGEHPHDGDHPHEEGEQR